MQTEYSFLSRIDVGLHRIAIRYASDTIEADDLYQAMQAGLIEKATKTPSFPEQTNSYKLQAAKFVAVHQVRAEITQKRYVESIPADIDFAASIPNPEAAVEQIETAFALLDMVKSLAPNDQQIIKLAYLGLKDTEIAKHIGITPVEVCRRRKAIRAAASEVL